MYLLKLLLAMIITIVGLIIISLFIKPSDKEIETFKNLEEAKTELFDVLAKGFKLPDLSEWLNKKFKK